MIDIQLIDNAKIIRKEFLQLKKELDKYEVDIRSLSDFLIKKMDEIKDFNEKTVKKIKSKEDISKVAQYLISNIEDIENEEKKLSIKVKDINTKMEQLKKDEIILYESIKRKYPNLTDEEMKKEVQSNLEE